MIIADTDSGRPYTVDPADLDLATLLALLPDPEVMAEIRRRTDTADTLPPAE